MFGWMDVDVDLLGVQIEKQYKTGLSIAMEHIPVGLFNGMLQAIIPDKTAVDIQKLRLSTAFGMLRANDAPKDLDVLMRSEEHTSELQSRGHLVCRLLLEKKKLT